MKIYRGAAMACFAAALLTFGPDGPAKWVSAGALFALATLFCLVDP